MSKTQERSEVWRRLIAQQEQSGLSVRAYCRQQGASEHNFYQWRKRLADLLPVKFALVETDKAGSRHPQVLELVLVTGERLRIESGFDAGALRAVLAILREAR